MSVIITCQFMKFIHFNQLYQLVCDICIYNLAAVFCLAQANANCVYKQLVCIHVLKNVCIYYNRTLVCKSSIPHEYMYEQVKM